MKQATREPIPAIVFEDGLTFRIRTLGDTELASNLYEVICEEDGRSCLAVGLELRKGGRVSVFLKKTAGVLGRKTLTLNELLFLKDEQREIWR